MQDKHLPDIIPYRQFRDLTVDLRGSGVMKGYELRGPSPETHSESVIFSRAEQLASAFRHLGTRDYVHIITDRVPAKVPPQATFPNLAAKLVDDELRAQFAVEGYWLTVSRLYLSHRYAKPIGNWFEAMLLSSNASQRIASSEVMRNHALSRFQAFEDAVGDALRPLDRAELFHDLMFSVMGYEHDLRLPDDDVRLNQVLGADHFIGGQAPQIGGWHLRPVSITGYPPHTVPQMLAVLLNRPGRMTVSVRFMCYDGYDQKQLLEKERTHWNREVLGSLWNGVKQWLTKNTKRDQDSQTQLACIDSAIAACAAGLSFGHATVTAIIRDRDAQQALIRAHDLVKDAHAHGLQARVEDVNAVEAIIGSWPGDGVHNLRRPIISADNVGDVALPVTRWLGLQ